MCEEHIYKYISIIIQIAILNYVWAFVLVEGERGVFNKAELLVSLSVPRWLSGNGCRKHTGV